MTANPGIVDGQITRLKLTARAGVYSVETSPELANWAEATTGVTDHGFSVEYILPGDEPAFFVHLVVVPV